jgi:hypothetical protein
MPPPAIRSAAHGPFCAPLRLEFCSPGRHRVRTFENLPTSADPDVDRPLGQARGWTQIIRFGVASGGRLGNKAAEHIGGSVRHVQRQDRSRSVDGGIGPPSS